MLMFLLNAIVIISLTLLDRWVMFPAMNINCCKTFCKLDKMPLKIIKKNIIMLINERECVRL